MPPDALTLQRPATVRAMSATSSTVAPPVEKPVLVLTKEAPASTAISHARAICSSESRQVSMMTFTQRPWAAATTASMSRRTRSSSPASSQPTLMTMSSSLAPSETAASVSAALPAVDMAPSGKPMTVQTLTSVSARREAHAPTQQEFTHTEANPCSTASSHSRAICSRVAFAARSVWSIILLRLIRAPLKQQGRREERSSRRPGLCGGAPSGVRTLGLGIKSPLLYQLS